ncbi:MAG TPA: Mu-like prophage major head subunit gpT family protein [Chloroflexota bacterium]|nr:Mu-like prophage major head subunit gpT family protein [Chloroflexota bacterium]
MSAVLALANPTSAAIHPSAAPGASTAESGAAALAEQLAVREAEIVSDERREVEVTVLEAGLSKMGWYYTPELLAASLPQFDGARAFADHPAPNDRPERSIRDVVGYYHSPRFVAAGTRPAHLRATLKVLESAPWLWSLLREAVATGHPDLVGLSVDFLGRVRNAEVDGRQVRLVESIQRLFSVDVVTRPSAGGRLERLLMSEGSGASSQAGSEIRQTAHEGQTTHEEGDADMAADQLLATLTNEPEAGGRDPGRSGALIAEADSGALADPALALARAEAQRLLDELARQRRAMEAERVIERELSQAGLPAAVTSKLRRGFEAAIQAGSPPEAAHVREAIDDERTLLAELAGAGIIQGLGFEKPSNGSITAGRGRLQKLQTALDQLLGVEVAEAERVPALSGIREAYVLATGDSALNSFGPAVALDESLVREAEVTTSSFSFLLGTSMNKRLLKDYQAWPAEWRRFCTEVPIKDFKQQDRIRLGAFGSLSQVAEDTAYTELTLTDTRAIYHANKYGNIVAVSREVIVNDDLHAIRQIPSKLAVAAAYTLAEFVYGFLSTGRTAVIYDGQTLFDAAAGPYNHGHNRVATALSSQAMQAGVTAMKEQANLAGKRIGLKPSFLVVPPELEFQAMTIVKSGGLPGGNFNDINPMLGYCEVVVSPQLADAVEWFLVADPRMVDTIEVGFVGGQVNPVLLVQDSPLLGLNFTQDVISYKIRHEYGGAVVDYRGFFSGGD